MATKVSKTAPLENPEKEMISELIENDQTDNSLINALKKDLRKMYVLANQTKEYREDFEEFHRDSMGFTFLKLSTFLDAVGNNVVTG